MRFNLRSLVWTSGICEPSMLRLFNLDDLSESSMNKEWHSAHPFRQCKLIVLKTVFNTFWIVIFFNWILFSYSGIALSRSFALLC